MSGVRVKRGVLALVGVFAIAVLAAGVWTGVDAWRARAHLAAASDAVDSLREQALAGETVEAAETLAVVQEHAAAARRLTRGPLWRILERAPLLGANVQAVQAVTGVVDFLATDALPDLTDAITVVNPRALAPRDGRIDLEPLVAVTPQVLAADSAVLAAKEEVDGVARPGLLPPVANAVDRAAGSIDAVAVATATARRAVVLLPAMLGRDGPREYVLLVQNNAEPRATGGIPGSVILLRAHDGALEITDTLAGNAIRYEEPILPLTPDERNIYSDLLGTHMLDVTFTPDFPRTAELARAMVQAHTGRPVDGVLSVDPVVLQGLLAATGPVTTADGTVLTGQDAADHLLNRVYLRIEDPAQQDAFFAAAARSVFDALTGSVGNGGQAIRALAQSARDGRLMVWSAHADEQAHLAGTVLSGELRGDVDGSPVVGVFLNDGTEAKIGYYLDVSVEVARLRCHPDGTRQLSVRVDIANTAPADPTSLPRYVTGGGRVVPDGVFRGNLLVYAPTGGYLENFWIEGEPVGGSPFLHEGLAVGGRTLELAPGERQSLEVGVVVAPEQQNPAVIRVTPGARTAEIVNGDFPC